MRGKISNLHPGVSYPSVQPKGNKVLFFRLDGKQFKKGFGDITDSQLEQYAIEISQVINGTYDREKISEKVKTVIGLNDIERNRLLPVVEKINSTIQTGDARAVIDEEGEIAAQVDINKPLGSEDVKLFPQGVVSILNYKNLLEENKKLQVVKKENEDLRDELNGYAKLIKNAGKIDNEKKHVPFQAALEKYLKTSKATERTKKEYKNYLKMFAEKFKINTLGDIKTKDDSDNALAFLNALKNGEYNRDKKPMSNAQARKVCNILIHFIVTATENSTPTFKLVAWRKSMGVNTKQEIDFHWLTHEEVRKMLKEARKISHYWENAIAVQYYMGFRPEELTFIQTKNVDLENLKFMVEPLMDENKNVVRNIKTAKKGFRFGKIDIFKYGKHGDCITHLKERMEKGNLLLFPREENIQIVNEKGQISDIRKVKSNAYAKMSDFEKKHKLWNLDAFCQTYLRVLRFCAAKAKLKDEVIQHIDSRTMRRSCGRFILDVMGGTLDDVAKQLRDNVATVYRYYAR